MGDEEEKQPLRPGFPLSFLASGGQMGALMRSFNWRTTSLGSPASWPQALRIAVRLLLTTSHPMYIWWGLDLLCFYNDAYRQSIGPERHPGSLGRPAREVWAEIWPIIGPQIEQVMSGRGALSCENALVPITRNGVHEEVYWTYSYSPIDDEDGPGGIGGVLVICTETTAQVLATRRAQQEQQRFEDLFEQAPTFIAVLRGPQHRIELANRNYRRLTGHCDLVGRTVAEALPDAVGQDYLERLDQVYRSGKPQAATVAKYAMEAAAGGLTTDHYIDFVYQPIKDRDGSVNGILVQGSDVTERVLANVALAESESRFRTLADNIPALCWMADETGAIFWYNSRWYEYTGTTPEQMKGWGWQAVHDPRVLAEVLEKWRASIATGTRFEMVFPLKSSSGDYRPFLTRVIPSCDATGKIIRWFGTNTDISPQLAAETALREADRRKDEFLATLAHELRNPLAPVRNASKVLRASGAVAKTRDWATTIIDRQVNRMATLLDDLLDVSKITRGQLTLHKQRVALSSVIDTSLEVARPLMDARQHTVQVSLPEDPIEIEVDPLRLSQVLSNLLCNAAKYTESGGTIRLSARQDKSGLSISVKDSGVGIAAESLESIFDMFSQVKGSIDRSEGGLGIGLSLVRGLIELHGGKVRALSEGIGRGSEFMIWLPVISPRTSEIENVLPPGGSQPTEPRRILVVDDNEDAAQSLGVLLELSGHEVFFAQDGEQALATAQELRPHIVLLDIGLPKLNGYAVAQAIRKEPWGEHLVLIALTGWGHDDDKRRALDAGFNFHLTKPVDPEQIGALISEQPTAG
ncbi:MAG: PAS domain-containing protein [Pseudomonadota bacterium]|nr:PAS domain-containing protein [Pseudomonadota bacterium]